MGSKYFKQFQIISLIVLLLVNVSAWSCNKKEQNETWRYVDEILTVFHEYEKVKSPYRYLSRLSKVIQTSNYLPSDCFPLDRKRIAQYKNTNYERETLEEIGYVLDLSKTRPSFTINFEVGFDDYYLVPRDIQIDTLVVQCEEFLADRWAFKDEILTILTKVQLLDYHEKSISLCFEMREKSDSNTTIKKYLMKK